MESSDGWMPAILYLNRDCCIKANRCVAFGIRLRSHTVVCSLQTSPSAPCASSFLQSLDNLASKIVRLLTLQQSQKSLLAFSTVSSGAKSSSPTQHRCWAGLLGVLDFYGETRARGSGLAVWCYYSIAMVRRAFCCSSSLILGIERVRTPSAMRAWMRSSSTLSGSMRVCSNLL